MSNNNNNNNNKERLPRKQKTAEQKAAAKATHEQKLQNAKDISFRAESFGDIQKAIQHAVSLNNMGTDERLKDALRSINAMTLKLSNLEKSHKFLTNGQAGRLMSTAGHLSIIAGKPRPCSTPEQVFDAVNSFINNKNALPKMFEDPDGNSVIMKSNASLIYTFKSLPFVGYTAGDEIYWVFLRRAAFRGVTILSVNPQSRAYRVIAYVSSQRNPNESGTLAAQVGTLFSVRVPTVAAGTGITVTSNVWAEQMIGTGQGPLLIPAGKFSLYNPRNTSKLLGTDTATYVDFPIMATDESVLTPSPADNINGSIWPITNPGLATEGLPASARSNITRNLTVTGSNVTANMATVGGFNPVVFSGFPNPFVLGVGATVVWRLSNHQMFRRYLFSGAFTLTSNLTINNTSTSGVIYNMAVVYDNGDGTDTTINVNLGITQAALGAWISNLRYCSSNTALSQYAGFLIRDITITAVTSVVGASIRTAVTDNVQVSVEFHDVDQAQQLVFGCLTGINDGYRAEFMLHSQAQNFRDSISKEGAALSDDFTHACDIGMFRDVLLQTAKEGDPANPDATVMETGSFLKKVKKFANKVAKNAAPALLNAIPGTPGIVARGVADFATSSCEIMPSFEPIPSYHAMTSAVNTEFSRSTLLRESLKRLIHFGLPVYFVFQQQQVLEEIRGYSLGCLHKTEPIDIPEWKYQCSVKHQREELRQLRLKFDSVLLKLEAFHRRVLTSVYRPRYPPSMIKVANGREYSQRSVTVTDIDVDLLFNHLNDCGLVLNRAAPTNSHFMYQVLDEPQRYPRIPRIDNCQWDATQRPNCAPSTFVLSLIDEHMREMASDVPDMTLKEYAGFDQWHMFPTKYTTDTEVLRYMQALLMSDRVKHTFVAMHHLDGIVAHVTVSCLGFMLVEEGFSQISCNLAVNDALIRMFRGVSRPFNTATFGMMPHIVKYRQTAPPSQEAVAGIVPGFYAPGVSQIDEDTAAYEIYAMTTAPALSAECFIKAAIPAIGSGVVTQGDSYTLAATLAALHQAGFPVKKGCYTGEVTRLYIAPGEFSFSIIPVAGRKMKLAACQVQDIMLTGYFPKICVVDNVQVKEFSPSDFFDDPTGVAIMSSPAPEGLEGPMLTFSYQSPSLQ